jgi:hypothetical protein
VHACLDRTFPGRWMDRDGPMPWPPRSPNITQLDFFLWGYVDHQLANPYPECDLDYVSGRAPQNMARVRISSGRYPCYQWSPHRGLIRSVENFQSFAVICSKPLAQFVCAPKCFKTPNRLCGHTVFMSRAAPCSGSGTGSTQSREYN